MGHLEKSKYAKYIQLDTAWNIYEGKIINNGHQIQKKLVYIRLRNQRGELKLLSPISKSCKKYI